jgi:F-type H+-transporting ATPase subunit gamma
MANLKEIRKRIASVKNTQKITRAMKLVAAARLRKAQENIVAARPFALETLQLLSSLAARAGADEELHPLLAKREPERVMLVVLTSDRGLAGSFNVGISKAAFRYQKQLSDGGAEVSYVAIGKKGADYFRRRGGKPAHGFSNVYEQLSYAKASEIGAQLIADYSAQKLDAVYLCYNEFKSAISQKVVMERLLPIEPMKVDEGATLQDFVYEPDQATILNTLMPMYVNVELYRALLESLASEHGARMTAMDNASKNAKEMIQKLTLQANRARQSAITTELTEIVSGAEALKG